jgi:hypothetical protein
VTGNEALENFFAQKTPLKKPITKKTLFAELWQAMRTKDVESTRRNTTFASRFSGLEKLYKEVIGPFEKQYRWRALPGRSVATTAAVTSSEAALSPPRTNGHDEDLTVGQARTAVQQCLEELRDKVLPQMQGSHQSKVPISKVTTLQDDIHGTLDAIAQGGPPTQWSDVPTVVLVGAAGQGKSNLANAMICANETPQQFYNLSSDVSGWSNEATPSAEDACRVAALRLGFRGADVDQQASLILEFDGSSERADDFTRRIIVSPLCPSVIHELPSAQSAASDAVQRGDSYIYDRTGKLNPAFKDIGEKKKIITYGNRMAALGHKADTKYHKYMIDETGQVDGTFLLPCSAGGQVGVTVLCTYIHGGAQYSMVVRYVTRASLLSKITATDEYSRSPDADQEKAEMMKREVLNQVYTVFSGVCTGDSDAFETYVCCIHSSLWYAFT